jgi:hypothetical protein
MYVMILVRRVQELTVTVTVTVTVTDKLIKIHELQKSPALPPQYLDSYADLFKAPLHEMNLPKPHSPYWSKAEVVLGELVLGQLLLLLP